MRALVPVPHRVHLAGRYEPRTKTALLTGRLTGAGRPRAGVKVHIFVASGSDTASRVGLNSRPWFLNRWLAALQPPVI